MSAPKVLIFGATGAVGSSAAVTAHALGASHITLAMRDTSKPLRPALSETETSHPTSFSRVQADLNDPSTVTSAVQSSGATHAFIYAVFSSPDGMRATIEALKAAGIEWVVLLSSGGLHEDADLKAVTPAKFIEWAHARVEVALQEVFGREGYVAVRPGYFASNLFQYSGQIARGGEVKVVYPEARFDFITPEDIGRVSGKLLVEGKGLLQGVGSNVVMLSGPQQISQGEAVKIIGEVVGKEVKAVGFEDDEDAIKATMENLHLPEPGARQLVQVFKAVASGAEVFDPSQYEKSVANIVKYAGKATVFREWVEENKDKFA